MKGVFFFSSMIYIFLFFHMWVPMFLLFVNCHEILLVDDEQSHVIVCLRTQHSWKSCLGGDHLQQCCTGGCWQCWQCWQVDNVDNVDNVKQEDFDKSYALPSLWEERTVCPQLVTAFPPFFWQLKQEQIIQDNFIRLKRRAAEMRVSDQVHLVCLVLVHLKDFKL